MRTSAAAHGVMAFVVDDVPYVESDPGAELRAVRPTKLHAGRQICACPPGLATRSRSEVGAGSVGPFLATRTAEAVMNTIVATAIAVLVCGCAPPPSTPGAGAHLSAAQEDVAAAGQEREAAAHRASFDPGARARREVCTHHGGRDSDSDFYECWQSVVNPTASQLREARQHERVADERRATSQALRFAEARACSGLSATDRDASPFAHRDDIASVSPLPRGAIVVFRHVPTLTAEHLQKIIDCHIARNDALGHDVPEMSYCPLVPRDVTARVAPVAEGFAVTIESTDPRAANEVRARAEALKP